MDVVLDSLTAEEDTLQGFFERIHECRDKRAGTHGLHPYPAKFIPHIPRMLIHELTKPGQVVLDPLCGSGTTLVEAAMLGRRSIGSDINPIATLVSQAKTLRLSGVGAREVRELIWSLAQSPTPLASAPDFPNRQHWFAEEIAQELAGILREVGRLSSRDAKIVALCSFSAIIVGVSRQESETRWAAKEKPLAKGEVRRRFIATLSEALARSLAYTSAVSETPIVMRADARTLPIGENIVDFVVTSPPYANSHDYYLYNKLRMFWLGFDVATVQEAEIGSRNKHSDQKLDINHYLDNMTGVLSEMRRVLAPSGVAAVVVGDAVIRGAFHDMAHEFATIASSVGLTLGRSYAFDHKRFTSAFQNGFGTRQVKQTHVLLFQKV
jgi:site-specific DNA-methyltransferase (cytosine-N4-specific)